MSYEKIVAATPVPALIRFYYLTSVIAQRVEKISSYKASSTIKADGRSDFDRIQLSIDELDLLKDYVKISMLKFFDLLFHIIASDSVVHDTGVVLSGAATVTAGSFVIGQGYTILVPGTTVFTLIGAANNEIGTSFTATGVGSGTGTAKVSDFGSYCDIKDNAKYRTINLDIIDKTIEDGIVDYVLARWYDLKSATADAQLHMTLYNNALAEVDKRSIALRQYA